jgi:hypothetical protein
MQRTQALLFGLTAALPFTAFADPAASEALVARFASIALPIAKGLCLRTVRAVSGGFEMERRPEVVALVDDQKAFNSVFLSNQICLAQM